MSSAVSYCVCRCSLLKEIFGVDTHWGMSASTAVHHTPRPRIQPQKQCALKVGYVSPCKVFQIVYALNFEIILNLFISTILDKIN